MLPPARAPILPDPAFDGDRQLCPNLDTFVDGMKLSLEALRDSVRCCA
jgi:hypothetical protein